MGDYIPPHKLGSQIIRGPINPSPMKSVPKPSKREKSSIFKRDRGFQKRRLLRELLVKQEP